MKKIISSLLFVLLGTTGFAQNAKVSSAAYLLENGSIEKAKIKIDEAVTSEKTKDMLKANFIKGKIYQAIGQNEDPNIQNLDLNPLEVSLEAYTKASELDEEGKYKLQLSTQGFNSLFSTFFQMGSDFYNIDSKEKALENFKLAYQAASHLTPEFVPNRDTMVFYPLQNLLLVSSELEKYEQVIEYGDKFFDLKFNDSGLFSLIAQAYVKTDRADEGIKILQESVEKFPDHASLFLNELINLYLENDQNEQAKEYLHKAVEKDPKNKSYHFALGVLSDKSEDKETSIIHYKKAIEIDPDYLDANFNLGAVYVNRAIVQFDEANTTVDQKKYEALKKEAEQTLLKAKPYLEKCYELNPNEPAVLHSLKDIYIRSGEQDKYDKIDKELKELQNK